MTPQHGLEVEVVTVTANPAIDHTVWVDGFRVGEVNRVRREHRAPGGKGVNVAVALATWGRRALATGFVGRAEREPFRAFLHEQGIRDRFVPVAGATRTGIKVLDEVAGTTTDLNFPGFEVPAAAVTALEEVVAQVARPGRWVALAGSLPVGVAAELYQRLATVAHDHGALVALDTSGPALAAAVEAGPDLIKPNRAELEELVGRALPTLDDVATAGSELAATGIATVIVSLGADGALFVRDGQVVAARPPRVPVASTVGAGDAMVAGALAATLAGVDLEELAALATAFGSVAVGTIGSVLDPSAIEGLAPQVAVERLR